MSEKRIKYFKKSENYYISFQSFKNSRGSLFEIHLDLNKMIFKIKRLNDSRVIFESSPYTNLNALKRAARCKLERQGVTLKKEVRDRNFGVVPKGFTQAKWKELNLSIKNNSEI